MTVNAYDAIRDGYASKAPAIKERRTANTCNAIRNGYACKVRATSERLLANAGKLAAFSKCHACKS